MQMWRAVIERTGSSRFPIDRAQLQMESAQQLLEEAEAAEIEVKVQDEHTSVPDGVAIKVEVPDVEMLEE